MGPPATCPDRRPDPRIERSRRVVLSAALDELGRAGYGGLTIEAVAARAGVAKSTIYRHWTGKLDLVEEAVATLRPTLVAPAGLGVRCRMMAVLEQVVANLADSTWSRCLPAIIDAAERDPDVAALHRRFSLQRRQVLIDVLADGVEAGEIGPGVDLELMAECLVGPIVVRRLFLHQPLGRATVPALVDQVLGPVLAVG